MKNKFKKGDRVKVFYLSHGTGTIIDINDNINASCKNLVKFDDSSYFSCGYGDDELELIEGVQPMKEEEWIDAQKKSHKREDKLMQIFDHFGATNQAEKLMEEAAELRVEIIEDNYLGIIEELADVEVLLDQIKVKYEICPEEIESIKKEKIDRTLKRIKEGYYNEHR